MYIKALEHEVLRLKDLYTNTTRERNAVVDENRRLKELLNAHGISYDFGTSPIKFQRQNSAYGPSSSGSISGSYGPASDSTHFSPPPLPVKVPQMQGQPGMSPPMPPQQQMRSMAQLPNNDIDYDQIGIDFVLTYDSQGRPILPAPAPYPSPPPQR